MLTAAWLRGAHAQTAAALAPIEQYRLPNGLRVVLAPDPALAGVSVVVRYDVGEANEPREYRGIAHLLEHVTFRGSRHLAPLEAMAILQRQGARFNAFTALEATTYPTQLSASGLESVLWLESERMAFTLDGVTQAGLQTEQRVVVNELRQRGQTFARLFDRYWRRELYGRDHPFAPGDNEVADVQAVSLPTLQWFFQTSYRPDNAKLVIAGQFELGPARALVDKYFADIVPAAPARTAVRAEPPRLCGVHRLQIGHAWPFGRRMRLGWPLAAPRSAAERAGVTVLAQVLERRLSRTLMKGRAKVSQLHVDVSEYVSHSLLSVSFALPEGAEADSIEAEVLRDAQDIGSHGVTPQELRSVRAQLLAQAVFERDDGLGRALALAGGDDPNQRTQALASLNPDDVRRLAVPLQGPLLTMLMQPARRKTGEVRVERRQDPCP